MPVPLIDLKFLNELAAGGAGTSNRRHLAVFRASVDFLNPFCYCRVPGWDLSAPRG
jgi:hypothetical protein